MLKQRQVNQFGERQKNYCGWKYDFIKSPERFLPDLWPTYFKSAKGCKVKDYDNNTYIDMSLMGVGTNVLGYSNSVVDNAVKKYIKREHVHFKL